ncbi:MAG: trigger factor [Candidatus Omnitrophica bacterium]|nr:trigger factor [Candidatus Omnitrophota bacterium]
MKSKVKKLDGTARELSIELSKVKVEQVFDEVFEDIRKTAKIPGFRPGKVPMDIVKKHHQGDAAEEVKRRLIPEAYQSALDEHEINPLSYPEVSDVKLSLTGEFTFIARVDAVPQVEVKKYKGLKVKTEKVKVTDDEIVKTLTRIQNINAEFIDIDEPLKKGDFSICDVETFIEGKVIAKKRENMWIEVNKEASMLGVGEELCGLKKGDKKDIEVVLPKNYPDKKYAGEKAVFHVEIKETKKKKLPELNNEFAKKIGKETMEEAKEEIKNQLFLGKEDSARGEMKNQIMKQLLDVHKINLPETMVARQLKVLMEKAGNELTQKGVLEKDIEDHKDKLKERFQIEAENKVKLYFLLDEIANREEISVNEEEVDNWIKNLAGSYSKPFDEVKKYYTENNLIGGLKEQLREEKALDFLLSEAVILEK